MYLFIITKDHMQRTVNTLPLSQNDLFPLINRVTKNPLMKEPTDLRPDMHSNGFTHWVGEHPYCHKDPTCLIMKGAICHIIYYIITMHGCFTLLVQEQLGNSVSLLYDQLSYYTVE